MKLLSASRRRLSQPEQQQPAGRLQAPTTEALGLGYHEESIVYDHPRVPETSSEDEEIDYIGELQRAPSYRRGVDAVSRASSVVSTGTKMSFRTLAQPDPQETQTHHGPIDIVLGRRNFRITPRPGSILSISSFDHPNSIHNPAPPYEADVDIEESITTLSEELLESSEEVEDTQNSLVHPKPQRIPISNLITTATADHADSSSRPPSPPSPPASPASTRVNLISAHYTNVVRTIDTNHRQEIARLLAHQESLLTQAHQEILALKATHTVELSQTRNDIDAAYRLEFREVRAKSEAQIRIWSSQIQTMEAKVEESDHLLNVTLDAIQKERGKVAEEREAERAKLISDRMTETSRLTSDYEEKTEHMRLEFERRLEIVRKNLAGEKDEAVRIARNEVEDVWEGRWRDRMKLAKEEIGAAFGERERVAACWEEEVRKRWPAAGEAVRNSVESRLKKARVEERKRSGSASSVGG